MKPLFFAFEKMQDFFVIYMFAEKIKTLMYTQKNNWRIFKFFWLYNSLENNFHTKHFRIW